MSSRLEQLVKSESAHSGLAFRELPYGPKERADLLRDLLGLANAEVHGPRYLFVGVRDTVGGDRSLSGITPVTWHDFKKRLGAMLAGKTEPLLRVSGRTLRVDDKLIGMLCLPDCDDQPYLLAASTSGLTAGSGWVRRGTSLAPLLRADLRRMFERKLARPTPFHEVRIGFGGDALLSELTLPALDLAELPSEVAARKLRQVLHAQTSAKRMFGTTETRLSRLVHAQVYGCDQPYVKHSEDSLRLRAARSGESHRAADEHYSFEVRAHRIELMVHNAGDNALQNVGLRITMPHVDGAGVAERLYNLTGSAGESGGYPLVKAGTRAITLETDIESIAPGAHVAAFRQAPRLWARPEAAGKAIPIHVTLHARELREPIHETLILRIAAA